MMSPLSPLEKLYGAILRARNARFDRETPHRLRWPVISVGNLSVGGAGKTPLVICLATLLQEARLHPDVLSRGYGRRERTIARVDPAGSADSFGDEPLLIARSAAIPVYVGASRYAAGLLAEKESSAPGVHLLDDGFQHRQLARVLDIVVMHPTDLEQRLLPIGRLREPLSSLHRAGVVVLRQEDAEMQSKLQPYVQTGCHFWRVRRRLVLPRPAERAIAFCGIARPAEFFTGLEAAGAGIAEKVRFRDHHRYAEADIDRLVALAKRLRCDAFVTTAKDDVRLHDAMRARLQTIAPLVVAALTVELDDPASALHHVRESLIVPEP